MSAALPATRPRTDGGAAAGCPCGGAELGTSVYATARGNERFGLRPCLRCGRLLLDPCPDDAALAAAYDRAYYGIGARKFLQPIESGLDLFRGGRARALDALVPGTAGRRRRVLDIGCGDGGFLAALAARGWECHGSEFSPLTAQRAAARTGLPILTGALDADAFAPASLDAVSIWHVLEHLRDPDRVLRDCARWLAPGGVLLVAVPNVASWQARAFAGDWFHLDPPFHLYHFDPRSLTRTLSDAGFEVAAVKHACWQYNPYGVLQSGLNALGFPRDALYDVLKGNRTAWSSPSRLAQALLAGCALPAAFVWSLLEAAAGAGGTIDVRARRR
ncbi:MAG: class I SAM-dependent methyltransferase [Vicinamibacteria bacterium]